MKNGDFSGLVDASGPPDPHLRPGDRPRRQRRLDARSVPGQHHPGRPHQPDGPGDHAVLPGRRTASTAGVAPWQQNLHWAEHFNKDLFWNWVGKVDHNFSAERPHLLPLGRERAQRDRATTQRHPQRPGPGRPAAAHRAPTARSSATGCTSSAAARCSTCAAATPTSSSGASPTRRVRLRFDRVLAGRASSPSCPSQAHRRHVPAHRDRPVRDPVARHRRRTGTGTTRSSRTCR